MRMYRVLAMNVKWGDLEKVRENGSLELELELESLDELALMWAIGESLPLCYPNPSRTRMKLTSVSPLSALLHWVDKEGLLSVLFLHA